MDNLAGSFCEYIPIYNDYNGKYSTILEYGLKLLPVKRIIDILRSIK